MGVTEYYSDEEIARQARWGGVTDADVRASFENLGESNIKPKSGEEIANIISEIYEKLDPEIASHLVDPSIVLALAGIKSYGEAFFLPYSESIKRSTNMNSRKLGKEGVSLSLIQEDATTCNLAIQNIKGYDRVSSLSHLPNVVRYYSQTGFDGLILWASSIKEGFKRAKESGDLPKDVNLDILEEGFFMGYPDTAVLDFEQAIRTGQLNRLVEVDLGYPEWYKLTSATPDFSYFPEHAEDPGIVGFVSEARRVFEEFYSSEWYKKLLQDPRFVEARKVSDERGELLMHKRWDELDRL